MKGAKKSKIFLVYIHVFLFSFLAITLTACGWVFPEKKDEETAGRRKIKLGFPEVLYKAVFEFKKNFPFEKDLKESSKLVKLETAPPTSIKALYYRCKADHNELLTVLKSFGYFDAKIKFKIKRKKTPINVVIVIDPGVRYKVGKINFSLIGDTQGINENIDITDEKLRKVFKCVGGSPVHMKGVISLLPRLKTYFENHGFPYVKIPFPEGELNRISKKMNLLVTIELGAYQVFGNTQFSSTDFITQTYLENRLGWVRGEPYDQRKVSKTRQKLLESGIFSTVLISPKEDGQKSKMIVQLEKGLPRTIGVGAKYATTDGLGVKAYWSHRNFLNKGHVVDAVFNLSRRESFFKFMHEQPDVFLKNLSFIAEIVGKYERTKAFDGFSCTPSLGFVHDNDEFLSYSAKIEGEYSRLKRDNIRFDSRIFSVPFTATYDTVNNPLNPVKGYKIWGELKPNFMGGYSHKNFVTVKLGGASYLRYNKDENMVLAAWFKSAIMPDTKIDDIPLNKRFYGGGAGSVRGYGFQLLSPLDNNGKPTGGKTSLEFGVEPRLKLTEKIGAVAFVEGGQISAGSAFKSTSLWGGGLGFRYYTDIGPIRLDVAMPFKKRHVNGRKIDSEVQFYISFGQAF